MNNEGNTPLITKIALIFILDIFGQFKYWKNNYRCNCKIRRCAILDLEFKEKHSKGLKCTFCKNELELMRSTYSNFPKRLTNVTIMYQTA